MYLYQLSVFKSYTCTGLPCLIPTCTAISVPPSTVFCELVILATANTPSDLST
nr:MAG TPA: hypothetical protein [Caudoviricetes sp.]